MSFGVRPGFLTLQFMSFPHTSFFTLIVQLRDSAPDHASFPSLIKCNPPSFFSGNLSVLCVYVCGFCCISCVNDFRFGPKTEMGVRHKLSETLRSSEPAYRITQSMGLISFWPGQNISGPGKALALWQRAEGRAYRLSN